MTDETTIRLWRACVLFLLAGAIAYAQTSLSTVRGTVSDPSGAVIPGVRLTLTDLATNIARTTASSQTGNYEFLDMQSGTYRLRAQAAGFKAFLADNLILDSSQIRRIDISMEVGETATEITVQAESAVIDLEDPKVSSSFGSQEWQEFPKVGASDLFHPQALLATMPGIQPDESGWGATIAGVSGQGQVGMDGAPTEGSYNQITNMENIASVKVVASNNSAEFSRAGYYDMVGKRGVNALHGQIFYHHMNSAFNARAFFEPSKASGKFHAFGAGMAGPIFKNRTFYYVAYSGLQDPSTTWYLRSVPTLAMRQGDFSSLLTIAQPIVVKDPLNAQPFPNNTVPASRMNALPLKVQELYIPAPNQGAPGAFTNNFAFLHPYSSDKFRGDSLHVRVDHKISSRNEFFGRLQQAWTPYVLAGNYPAMAWTRLRYAWHMVFSDTHVLSPNLVNTARFGWYKSNVDDGNAVDGFMPIHGDDVVKQIGLEGVNPDGLSAQGFPVMSISGYTTLQVNPGGAVNHDNSRQYAEGLTWVHGRHTMKMGGEFKTFDRFVGTLPTNTYGSFSFTNTFSGYSYANFLLGLPAQSIRLRPLTNRNSQSWELGMYFTDAWKVHRRLTLNYGLRWDYFGAPTYADSLQYNFDLETGTVLVPDEKALQSISPLYPTDRIKVAVGDVIARPPRRNFAPRLGAAYMFNNKTAVHGGYGIYNEFLGEYRYATTGGPYLLQETFSNRITNGQPLFSFPNPYPAAAGSIPSQSVTGYPIDMRTGRIHQFNITLERQVGGIGLSAAYIGSRSYGLNYNLSINQQPFTIDPATGSRPPRPYPQLSTVTWAMRDGDARYNSLVLRGHGKLGQRVTLDSHWTWAHNMANYLNTENSYSHYFWNRVSYTPQQRAVTKLSWSLPVGRGQRFLGSASKVVDGIAGGWQLFWVASCQTGLYFSPTYSGTNPLDGLTYSGSPDRIANGNLPPNERTVERWFDTAAFIAPPRDRLGNSGKNILEAPGRHVHSLSVSKYFRIHERMQLHLMMAANNIFNRPNFVAPSNNVVGVTGGVVSAVVANTNMDKAYARRMDARVRITW